MRFIRRSQRTTAPEGSHSGSSGGLSAHGDIAASIARGSGNQSPDALVAAARDALDRGDSQRALELAQRARDRNDDFAYALPSMTGRKPLREAIYHPTLYGMLIDTLRQCSTSGAMDAQQAADVAHTEYRWMNRDYPRLYGSGNEAYWHLFLSDYLYLYALAFASGVNPSRAEEHELDGEIVRILAGRADAVAPGSLTKLGEQAKARIFNQAGRPPPLAPATYLIRPESADEMPCGRLITQEEITEWLTHDRDQPGAGDLPLSALPAYHPNRNRAARPEGATLTDLRALSQEQVGHAQVVPDAWWKAADFGLYRWEMLHHFDQETTDWVSDLAYGLYAAKERGDAPDSPLWDWRNLVDLFQYCLDRLETLLPTIDPGDADARRAAYGTRNYFAWSLYECMRAASQTSAWNAFEPQLYAILNESHPQELTAAQTSTLRRLRQKYSSLDIHS